MNKTDEQKIIDLYYDIENGLTTDTKQIYIKLDKKIKLSFIKDVINKIKNKQINSSKNEKKLFIPIVGPKNWFQCDLTFYNQYKKFNSGFWIIWNIININTKYLYSYLLKNKLQKSIIEAFKKFINTCNDIIIFEVDEGSEFISNDFKKLLNDNDIKLILFNKNKFPNTLKN